MLIRKHVTNIDYMCITKFLIKKLINELINECH